MEAVPKDSIPATCADCLTKMQLAGPGAKIQEIPSKWAQSAEGKTRVDFPDMSIITDPKARQTLILDHVKKEFRRIPMPEKPPVPEIPQMPGMPGMPKPPEMPQVNVQDLGKSFIDGIEVQGKRYIAKLPPMPPKPQIPQMPKLPNQPDPPETTEIWSSVKDKLPILTKSFGKFGQQICKCKFVVGEPPAAQFQIPPEYKEVPAHPPPPQLPKPPDMPQAPKLA